jgi:hypothetical protein
MVEEGQAFESVTPGHIRGCWSKERAFRIQALTGRTTAIPRK